MEDKGVTTLAGATLWQVDGTRVGVRPIGAGALVVRVVHEGDRAGLPPGTVPALDAGAGPLAEAGPAGRLEVAGLAVAYDPDERTLGVTDASGRALVRTPAGGMAASPGRASIEVLLPEAGEILGFGAKMGPFARRGRRYVFWNRDVYPHTPDADPMYASLPFALVLDGVEAYGLALAWGGEGRWDVGHDRRDRMRVESVGGGLDLVVLAGPRPADVMARLGRVFGPYALPPLWALGYQQSHWGYGDAEGFLAVAREFRARGLPLDAMYMDLDYEDGRRPLLWDRAKFPDPKAFVDALHAIDVRIVPISNAGLNTEDPRYPEAEAADALVRGADGAPATGPLWGGDTAITDYLRPEAAELWHRFYAPVLADGVDGIWNDMNEPSFIIPEGDDPRGPRTLPADAVHRDRDGGLWRHDAVHNVFPLCMNRATYESLVRHRPGRRPFILSRAGYLGVGRYSALWTGDNASWWEHLRASLPTVAGMGLSGVPLAGVDIGGFNDEASPELFARWLAVGSLMPLCRNHSSINSPAQEPYAFGPEVEAIARGHMRLRYAMLPYLYSLLYAAHAGGEPIWRPLGYQYPADPTALRLEDEVLVGPDLLIAPVLETGREARAVYLPEGRWYRIDGPEAQAFTGGGYHLAAAPLAVLPLYARGGGILVSDPAPADRVRRFERIDVTVLPGGRGEFTLFEDDGETTAYERGDRRLTHLAWEEAAGRGVLSLRREGRGRGARLRLRAPAGMEVAAARVRGGADLDRDLSLPDADALTVEVAFGPRR